MYKPAIIFILLIIILVYEKFRRPIICKRKIYEYIQSLNGQILDIKRLSIREEIYLIDYKIGEDSHRLTVKYNLFYKGIWY